VNCQCESVGGANGDEIFAGRKSVEVFYVKEDKSVELYNMQCDEALVHAVTDAAFHVNECEQLATDFGWGLYDRVDQDEIKEYMMSAESEKETYDWNGPESQLCRRILQDWRSEGDIFDECRSMIRFKILSKTFMEVHTVCRGAAMRRENWRVLFDGTKPGELPNVGLKEKGNILPPLSSVSYISPFPEMKEKGRICFFERLQYYQRNWYFVAPTETFELLECNTNSQRSIPGTRYQKKTFAVNVITPEAMAEMMALSNTVEKVIETKQFLANRFQGESHGHIIQDTAIPLFHVMQQVGVFDNTYVDKEQERQQDYNIIFDDKDEDYDNVVDGMLANGPMQHDTWFKSISPLRRPMYIDEVDELLCPFQNHCVFSTLYTGYDDLNLLGPHLSMSSFDKQGTRLTNVDSDVDPRAFDHRSRVLYDFNKIAVHNMLGDENEEISRLLENDASADLASGKIVVTLVQRRHSRIVINMEDVKEAVSSVLGGELDGVCKVNVVDPEDLDPVSQVKLIRNSTIIIAVEGGALDTLVYSRINTVVVAWGRNPSADMPEGAKVTDEKGNSISISFWHELAFLNWARRPPEGLGMHVFPVVTPPGEGYVVDVEGTVRAVTEGLRMLRIDAFVSVLGGAVTEGRKNLIEVRREVQNWCMSQGCDAAKIDDIFDRIWSPLTGNGVKQ